jgi:hypothetical protein
MRVMADDGDRHIKERRPARHALRHNALGDGIASAARPPPPDQAIAIGIP